MEDQLDVTCYFISLLTCSNKIASDIKLVFHSSTITMLHGPINVSVYVDSILLYLDSFLKESVAADGLSVYLRHFKFILVLN